jgi:hypothetical protein
VIEMAKIRQIVECPTCAAMRAVLGIARVPGPVANRISRSPQVRALDSAIKQTGVQVAKRKLSSKAKKQSKILAEELKKANKRARKKDGSLKKGYTQSRIMKEAHKAKAKRMK